ncbi:MAG: hypothetical protein EOP48_22010 [Sphingobacteriales bacterium]|nr:MAG: hypothetical protein EOP48_22010 [Sphingobacteriales bacterium]
MYGRMLNAFMMSQIELGNLALNKPQRLHCPACHNNDVGRVYMAGDGNMSFQGKHKYSGIDPLYQEIWVHRDLSAQTLNEDKSYAKNCQDC